MFVLILVTCFVNNPLDCRKEVVKDNMQETECNITWQQYAAQFIGVHPDREFRGYICATPHEVQFYLGQEI